LIRIDRSAEIGGRTQTHRGAVTSLDRERSRSEPEAW
jgi:hypothetical protein